MNRNLLCTAALAAAFAATVAATVANAQTPRQLSGIYPHLAHFNSQGECGTGAVVPWAGRLWVVTYSPHMPGGSDDKLYEIDDQLRRVTRPESIGGTPANRMIHRESNQLFIGPYAIDAQRNVRAIPYTLMYGRPTGNARHLTDPAHKIYFASMEEGFFEVDVDTLAVRTLYEDANGPVRRKEAKDVAGPLLPGYHGKGFYSGQGRTVYSNNGELGAGTKPPDTVSGCLAEWDGKTWNVVRRNQFCEVTGPGGLSGNANPATDPIWATGWDHRSVILMLLDHGKWHSYRLPKATHTYDGAHGWNTEWPRIRDIGEQDLLMTMHGMFWRFPKTFSAANSAGIAPRSTYLKVIGDFTRWNDRLVFGCDDTAQSEFLNTKRVKGKVAAPGQAQSNLWFVEPSKVDRLGAPLGRGAVWIRDDVKKGEASEPYLFAGFERRMLQLTHESDAAVTFTLEVDRAGNGAWTKLRDVKVAAGAAAFESFGAAERAAWIRIKTDRDARKATAYFEYSNADARGAEAPLFAGLAKAGGARGLVWARGEKKGTLLYSTAEGLYELDADLALKRVEDVKLQEWMRTNLAPPADALTGDAASIVYVDEAGQRWRLPRGEAGAAAAGGRVAREVSTERDLLNAGGTFFELPSNNAGGIAMVRPIATHNRAIDDFGSWRGLLVLSGALEDGAAGEHIVRPAGAKAGLWLGAFDDLWQFGKARGEGGPWKDTEVKANAPSDAYLMTGYDRKSLRLAHAGAGTVKMRVEVDLTGTGVWAPYRTFDVPAGRGVEHEFPAGFAAYWVRTVALSDTKATAWFTYR